VFGAAGPFPAESAALVSQLSANAEPEVAKQVEFLGRCAVLALDPLVTAFAWNSRGPTGATSAALAVVFDDSRLDPAAVQRVIDELARAAQ